MVKKVASIYRLLLIGILLVLLSNTSYSQPPEDSTLVQNQEAEIKLIICSRGCYQYVLELKNSPLANYLYPKNLHDSLKTRNTPVLVSGHILADSTQIFKAGDNDIPIPLFMVPNFRIKTLNKIYP